MIILITGIPRSGSTFLFNFVRIFLIQFVGLSQIECGFLRPLSHKLSDHKIFLFKLHEVSNDIYEQLCSRTFVFTIHSSRSIQDAHDSYVKFSSQWETDNSYFSYDKIKELDERWTQKCDFKVHYQDLFSSNNIPILHQLTSVLYEQIQTYSKVTFKKQDIDVETLLKETHLVTRTMPTQFHPLTLLYTNHRTKGHQLSNQFATSSAAEVTAFPTSSATETIAFPTGAK